MSTHRDFAQALLAPEAPSPTCTRDPRGGAAGVRFDVYRNNVTVSLIEAMEAAFPVVGQLVGKAFFTAMAREFVRAHPPTSPVMAFYGAPFVGWLRDFPPVASLPYLPEVAAIEQARREAYHAADAAPLDAQRLSRIGPDALAALHLTPHPSVRMIETAHPALSVWAQNVGRDDLMRAPAGEVLVCRPAMTVTIHAAARGTAATLAALAAGIPLGRALPREADAPALLGCLFRAGALMDIGVPE